MWSSAVVERYGDVAARLRGWCSRPGRDSRLRDRPPQRVAVASNKPRNTRERESQRALWQWSWGVSRVDRANTWDRLRARKVSEEGVGSEPCHVTDDYVVVVGEDGFTAVEGVYPHATVKIGMNDVTLAPQSHGGDRLDESANIEGKFARAASDREA